MLIAAITGCHKFLDVQQQGAITSKDVSSPQNVDGLVIAAYAWVPHAWTLGVKMSPWLADIRSDDSYKGGGGLGDQLPWYQWEVFSLVTPNVGNSDGMWFGQYEGISRCNAALAALNSLTDAEYPLKETRIAEMHFIRGYLYMDLKKWYRWIPYFDETVGPDSIPKISNHPDTAKSDMYLWQDIYNDFAAAFKGLPATQTDLGRPTKYAAEAEMANVLMWMAYPEDANNQLIGVDKGKLSQALDLLNDIINSGKYSLNPDFSSNFEYTMDNKSPEAVWQWEYTYNDGTPNGNLNGSTPLNAPWWPPNFSCCDFHKVSYTMVNAFRVDKDGIPLFDSSNNAEMTNAKTYFATNSWDPRFGHTVALPGLPWKYQTSLLFDSSGSRDPTDYGYMNSLKENVEAGAPVLVNLFWMWNAMNETPIRYDRILLFKAEILIQLGRDAEALPIINQIRNRAANSTSRLVFANGNPTLPYKIEPYIDGVNCHWTHDFAWKALQFENRLEFAMEGERWWDIIRWGIADSVMNNYFAKEAPRGRSWLSNGHFTKGRDEYLPIPQPQINYSYGLYKQNVGY